jgi:hypothetical protein
MSWSPSFCACDSSDWSLLRVGASASLITLARNAASVRRWAFSADSEGLARISLRSWGRLAWPER